MNIINDKQIAWNHNLRKWLLIQKCHARGIPNEEIRRMVWLFDNQKERKKLAEELDGRSR